MACLLAVFLVEKKFQANNQYIFNNHHIQHEILTLKNDDDQNFNYTPPLIPLHPLCNQHLQNWDSVSIKNIEIHKLKTSQA